MYVFAKQKDFTKKKTAVCQNGNTADNKEKKRKKKEY